MTERPPELVGPGITQQDIDDHNGHVMRVNEVVAFGAPCGAGPIKDSEFKLDGRVYHLGGLVRLVSGMVLEADAYFVTYHRKWLASIGACFMDRYYGLTRDVDQLTGIKFRPGLKLKGFDKEWIEVAQHFELPRVELPPDRQGDGLRSHGSWSTANRAAYSYIGPGVVSTDPVQVVQLDGRSYWVSGSIKDRQGKGHYSWLLITTCHFRYLEAAYLVIADRLIELRSAEGREHLAQWGLDVESCWWEPDTPMASLWRDQDYLIPDQYWTKQT